MMKFMDYRKRSKSFINNVLNNSSRILREKNQEKIDNYVLIFIVNTFIVLLVVDVKSTLCGTALFRQNDNTWHHYHSLLFRNNRSITIVNVKYRITSILKVETDIAANISVSPNRTSWDISHNVCQGLQNSRLFQWHTLKGKCPILR